VPTQRAQALWPRGAQGKAMSGATSGVRRARLSLAMVCTLVSWLVLAGAPASADITHAFLGSFNGADAPAGPFAIVLSDATDDSGGPSSGDVYVGELNHSHEGVIDKFNSKGEYAGVQITGASTPQDSLELVSFSTFASGSLAVDDSSSVNKGDVYVALPGAGVVDKFNEAGEYLGQITGSATPAESMEPTGVAVDASGNVYVADFAHKVIDRFSPTGAYAGQFVDPHIQEPNSIAVDAGHLYVDNAIPLISPGVNVDAFSSTEFAGVLDEHSPGTVTFDPIDGHIYTGDDQSPSEIREYDPSSPVSQSLLDAFGAGDVEKVVGLSAGPSGTLYAADLGKGTVEMFGPDVILPDVSVAATEDEKTGATLTGRVDPAGGGEVTECKFEFGTSTAYGESAPCAPTAPYQSATNVDAHVTGLAEGVTYHFRLVASNANGTDQGEDHVFGPPAIDSESATAATTTATIRAQIDPSGVPTTCEVQYVDETEFQADGYGDAASAWCANEVGWEAGERSAVATLTGLQLDTTYHYRFIATSGAGVATGEDHTFATFGVASFSFAPLDEEGHDYTQAGGHPYELQDSFTLNTSPNAFEELSADTNVKDVRTELPPGLIGNPDAVPKCAPYNVTHADCSGASQVGVLTVYTGRKPEGTVSPIYNLVPPNGLAAQLGARFNGYVTVHIDAYVRTGSDYGVTAEVLNSSAVESVTGASVRLWGVPAEEIHYEERDCPSPGQINEETHCASDVPAVPFLTNPTSCRGPQTTTMSLDSWQAQGSFVQAESQMPGFTGCGKLSFTPQMTIQPESSAADSPTGLAVDLHIPQNENPTGLAEADLKNAAVTLPQGVTVNPSSANGLQACSPEQIELNGPQPAQCPNASKIGSVELTTPLVEHPLHGAVYVAQQNANPFKSLLAIYIAIDDPQTGVVVKLAGHVQLDEKTGQLTTTFDENPQLPFEELKLDFFGGERAALATPRECGTYTTTSLLEPWSHQGAPGEEGTPDASPGSPFSITSGPGGSACTPSSFAPSFVAGTTNPQADAFSPFTLTLARKDGEQTLGSLNMTLPPGLAGILASVAQCGEAQANAGACPAASQIGHVTVQAGVGNEPITLPQAGRAEDPVYLTGPYDGAPFGLAVVVHPEAGPFNLEENGHPVVVRAKIEVNPYTGQASVASGAMPTILRGIPLDVRTVDVTIDRPSFMFNPTDCAPMSIAGAVSSSEGASEGVSSRFQAANCATLPFNPKFTVSTQGKTSKADGASLDVKLASKGGPQAGGGEANIRAVKVDLPKQLPSRLTTLQKACTEAQFYANPADCPAASNVGTASATTPIFSHPLTGPAYFVSHGGQAFPDLEIVLQGEGVTLILDGNTDIKNGITSSIFRSLPDAPISSFELKLPAGPYSILGTNLPARAKYSLCGQKLAMPTAFVGQNGAEIHESTPIAVEGCKPAIRVLKSSVRGATATIEVSVPAAGRLVASGRGLSKASRKVKRAGTATVKLKLTSGEAAFLKRHPGRRLKADVHLRFTPSKGGRLNAGTTVLIR